MRGIDIYLNDHLAGATAGLALARRTADARRDHHAAAALDRVVAEIAEDRDTLLGVMAALDVRQRRFKQRLALLGERLGRLKLNGRIISRSPVSGVLELEALLLGIQGKAAGWHVLRRLAETDDRLDRRQLDNLITRAAAQAESVDALRLDTATQILPRHITPNP